MFKDHDDNLRAIWMIDMFFACLGLLLIALAVGIIAT